MLVTRRRPLWHTAYMTVSTEDRDWLCRRFLDELRRHGVVGRAVEDTQRAARALNPSRPDDPIHVPVGATFYEWRRADEEFSRAWVDAREMAVDDAEMEVRRRAVDGWDEPVFYKGEPVWRRDPATGHMLLDGDFEPIQLSVRRRSDRLLETYVKANRRKYGDRTTVGFEGGEDSMVPAITINFVKPTQKPEWVNPDVDAEADDTEEDGPDPFD